MQHRLSADHRSSWWTQNRKTISRQHREKDLTEDSRSSNSSDICVHRTRNSCKDTQGSVTDMNKQTINHQEGKRTW